MPAPLEPIEKHARFVDPAHIKLLGILGYGRVFVRARDVWLWDQKGQRYLDLIAGYGSMNIGHNHPRLIAKLKEFLDSDPINLCHVGISRHEGDVGERLAALAGPPLQMVTLTNSGAEAVEAGLKLARIATHRSEFIYAKGGFHGLSFGTLSLMGKPRTRRPVEPLLAGCHAVPFGDLDALERLLSRRRIAAFLVEPIQCEGGVVLPPPGYLKGAAELCQRHGALLILDEVQVGIGRVGSWFAFHEEGFVPDVLVTAKALGGGLLPIGATLTSAQTYERAFGALDTYGINSSTFGGNGLACAAALATLDIIEEESLLANTRARGEQLLSRLRELLRGHPFVRDIRGRGLIVGIELGPTESGLLNRLSPWLVSTLSHSLFGHFVSLRLLESGYVVQPTGHEWNVLRIEPALTIDAAQIEEVAQAIHRILAEYQTLGPLIKDATLRLGHQFRAGWSLES